MGLDTYFNITGADGVQRRSLWRKNNHAILWFACFRVSDIVFGSERDCSYIKTVRCDVGVARIQFEQGLAVLRQTFPDTDFDIAEKPYPIGVTAFQELLAGIPSGYAELPNFMWADFSGNHFDKFLMHALLGFSNPGCKMFYDQADIKRGLYLPPAQRVPGVMTWGDVLRALTLGHVGTTLRHLGEGSQIHPPTALFTADEYAREPSCLAGS